MKKFLTKVMCGTALAASAVVVPALAGTAPANAADCTHNWAALGRWGTNTGTTQVAATNTCANMWSVKVKPYAVNNEVKGRFKKNGVWVDSIAGWKKTTTNADAKQIVAALVDGEPLRAYVRYYGTQDVMIWY